MTDRRRISSLPVLAAALLITISSSVSWSASYAEGDNQTSIQASNHQHPAVQIGLFSGLTGLNPAKMLRDVQTGLNTEIAPSTDFTISPLAAAVFDLLQYMRNNIDNRTEEELLAAIPKYNRVEMFGGWVNENAPENCLNTRAEVLMRDATSTDKIKFSSQNPCQVFKGEWNDPYSGKTYKLAKAVQIDHVVPLKNAYKSGAYQWTKDRRCHYANYLREDNHLLAVSGHENMSKGDAGPERYLPPNEEYICEYVHNWLKIKATWSLGFTPNEALAVLETLETHQCNASTTKVALPKIQNSRLGTIRMNIKCVDEFEAEQEPVLKPTALEARAS
ncbi:MAG: DUF1524 domain-containing protein [Bdellovibrionales bacterium]|nr:DUF1524 domain-containing protein [Bdellovibrionales bacterium]